VSALALTLGVAAFVALLKLMRAADIGGDALRVAHAAVATMSAAELSDDEKEVRVRRAAEQMLRSFLAIALIGIVALAVPVAIVWAGSALGLYTIERVIAVASGWSFLLGSSAAAVLLWVALSRRG
jgi:hypothetical protein